MTADEKMAIQNVLVEYLRLQAERQPTLLVDVLLGGDGANFVRQVIIEQEWAARQRAGILSRLMRVTGPPPPEPEEVAPPSPDRAPMSYHPPIPPGMGGGTR